MNIQCPNCKTNYKIDDAIIPHKGVYSRCKKCQTKFFVKKEAKPSEKKQDTKWMECPECGLTQTPSQTCKYCDAPISASNGSVKEEIQSKKETPENKEDLTINGDKKISEKSDISVQEKLIDLYVDQEDQEKAAKLLPFPDSQETIISDAPLKVLSVISEDSWGFRIIIGIRTMILTRYFVPLRIRLLIFY